MQHHRSARDQATVPAAVLEEQRAQAYEGLHWETRRPYCLKSNSNTKKFERGAVPMSEAEADNCCGDKAAPVAARAVQ